MDDVFAHMNYRYPEISNVVPSPASQQPQEPHCRTSIPNIQHQTHSVDFAAGHSLLPQQKNILASPRGAVHSGSKHSLKMYYTDESANLSDQYIPSSSDKITCTNHRPLDVIFGSSSSSSGRPYATSDSSHPSPSGRPHGRPQHSSVLTYTLPTRPLLDDVVQIPLLAIDNRMSGTGLVVDFRCSDWGIGVLTEGIPMSDLLHSNVSGLEDPNQRVLDGFGILSLRLDILWPHYPPFAKVISAFGTDGKPMTRAGLGYEVSLAFAEFFYQITSLSILPTQLGPYVISSSGSSSPGIKFEQLHLITVRNTSRGEWMAEVRAVLIP